MPESSLTSVNHPSSRQSWLSARWRATPLTLLRDERSLDTTWSFDLSYVSQASGIGTLCRKESGMSQRDFQSTSPLTWPSSNATTNNRPRKKLNAVPLARNHRRPSPFTVRASPLPCADRPTNQNQFAAASLTKPRGPRESPRRDRRLQSTSFAVPNSVGPSDHDPTDSVLSRRKSSGSRFSFR